MLTHKMLSQKNFGSKKILVPEKSLVKKFWAQKDLGFKKKIWIKNFMAKHFFGCNEILAQ